MKSILKNQKGFSILEIVLAAAVFCIFSAAAVSFLFLTLKAETQSQQEQSAIQYAQEGLEAVRAIRDDSFDRLSDRDSSGLDFSDGKWDFKDDYDSFDIFKRTIAIDTAKRDGENNIISSGTADDSDMKKVVSSVSWKTSSGEDVSVEMTTYLARWK
jgi:prepilin-type N-terminal cleavage/methylation domain-containing protein